jgi:spore protease
MEISEKTLGVPVIAIGVPTVVDAATMANDTIDLVLDEMITQATQGGKFYDMLKSIDKNEKARMIQEILNPYVGNLVVTPKEVDMVIDAVSKIIANGINIALQPALELDDINRYLN